MSYVLNKKNCLLKKSIWFDSFTQKKKIIIRVSAVTIRYVYVHH